MQWLKPAKYTKHSPYSEVPYEYMDMFDCINLNDSFVY